ncbi:MAG: leucine-rich repeat domain-containing protein [Marinilabiliaceae bacterium]|nr:leucine-rich repeat domain-containing protein [Marinilabiliaceae bacterium]
MTNTKISISVCLMPKMRLKQALKEAGVVNPASIGKLTVSGIIAKNDFRFIHKNMDKTLIELDMSDATIKDNIFPDWDYLGCSGLISICFPKTVEKIDRKFLISHRNLCKIGVHPDNSVFESDDGVLFNKGKTKLIFYPRQKQGDYVIPDTVTEIEDWAFKYCDWLQSIFIPASVTKIGSYVFDGSFITVHPDNPTYTSVNGKLALKEIKSVTGNIGDMQWTLADGVLTISGNGEIPDYDDCNNPSEVGHYTEEGRSPWYPYSKHVKKIVFKGDIRLKGLFAFNGCENCHSVTFNDCTIPHFSNRSLNVNDIIVQAFKGCTLTDVRNFKNWFSYKIPFVIQEFKQKAMGHPGHMTSQEWDAILDRITFCFSEMQKPFPTSDYEIKVRENLKNEGFELMKVNFWGLWW